MAEFYKMNPAKWDFGTANLTLEQEAAYLRIINAINKADEPCPANPHVLAGLFRCNTQKAKRLLRDLIDAGKVWVEDGKILNRYAMSDVRVRSELRATRQAAGKLGGTQKQLNRTKPLENKETGVANATPREEKRREEKKEPPKPPKGDGDFEDWYSYYPKKVGKGQARRAFATASKKVSQEDLITAVKAYAARVSGKDRQFIPNPSTWLNGERWDDKEGPGDVNGVAPIEARLKVAKDWLSRHDDVPTWMDNRETWEALLKEGYDYDKLRIAGFSLPPRGNVVDITGFTPDLNRAGGD